MKTYARTPSLGRQSTDSTVFLTGATLNSDIHIASRGLVVTPHPYVYTTKALFR
jgi:hypothetical protein